MMVKSVNDYFADWEAHVFGFGYGSGEPHTVPALHAFLSAVPDEGGYDYQVLEAACGSAVAWLLINILCHADIIEYGTSPRYGWLTPEGKALKAYVCEHDADFLIEQTCRDCDYIPCYPNHCNCDGEPCSNPFWENRR